MSFGAAPCSGLVYVSVCVISTCFGARASPYGSKRTLSPPPPPSQGFGTGGVGDGVGHGLLRVAAVVVDLEQDGDVHQHLQEAACPKLHRGLGEQEVARLEGVAAGPHQHHLDAVNTFKNIQNMQVNQSRSISHQ